MKRYKNEVSSATLCRGVIAASVLAGALTLHAEQRATDNPNYGAGVTHRAIVANDTSLASDPATCLKEAAKMNMATIRFAQLAVQKAENPRLQRFGQMLEDDSKEAQAKLETIAKKENVALPTSLDATCEAEVTRLQGLTGGEFDREFAKRTVQGHAEALAQLEKASKETKDYDLAQYCKDMLVRVKDHQESARDVAKAIGLDQTTIAALEDKAKDGLGAPGTSEKGSDSLQSLSEKAGWLRDQAKRRS